MASNRSIVNVLAYIAVILVGVALIIKSFIGGTQIGYILKTAADIIAYIILTIASFTYAKTRRNVAYIIFWIIAVVLIVVSYII